MTPARFKGLPVNLPYYWRVILRAPSEVSGFMHGLNDTYEDLFFDVTNFYYNSSLQSAQAFRKHLVRLVTIKALPLDIYAGLATEEYRKHFKEAGFLVPNTYVLPSSPDYAKYLTGSFCAHSMAADVAGVDTLTDAPDNPRVTYTNDVDFIVQDGAIVFSTYPFAPYGGKTPPYWEESYTAPWGDTYPVLVVRYLANSVSLSESPLYDGYGGLVYYKTPSDPEEEITYRNKILGLFLLFYRGLTPHALDACLNLFLGMPVTLHHNEVVSEIRDGGPDFWEVRTSREVYTVTKSLPLNEQVKVGAVLSKFSPLNAAVEINMNSDDDNWINGVTLPTRYLCVQDIETGAETAVTINTDTVQDEAIPAEANISDGGGVLISLGYDTPGVAPFQHPGQVTPDVYSRNRYLWEAIFEPVMFKIKFNVAVDLEVISFVDTILHDIMPVWTTYLLEYFDEYGEPTLFMAGEYMDKEYSSSFLD